MRTVNGCKGVVAGVEADGGRLDLVDLVHEGRLPEHPTFPLLV